MYPSAVGLKFLVQYAVSGTGAFNGTEYGRARRTIDPSLGTNSIVYCASKIYGVSSNSLTIEYIDAGVGIIIPTTVVTQTGAAIRVTLRRSSSAILATSAEIVSVINSFTAYSSPAFAISAFSGGDGSGVVAAIGPLTFTGGADPLRIGSQFLWTIPTNGNAGFVHFEQPFPMWVLGFSARFIISAPGPYTISVARVRLNPDFTPIMSEVVNLFIFGGLTPTALDIAYSDVKQLIHSGQGLVVTTSSPLVGFFNFDVMRAGEFPYA